MKKQVAANGADAVAAETISALKNEAFNAVVSVTENTVNAQLSLLHDKSNRPLFGVPIAIKDNIAVKGERLTCASKILENYIVPYNATVVERLRDAGAVIVAKTNMDEFAMGSSSERSAFGPIKNPLNPAYVPGGSSGGSAAVVSAGIVPAALGSDTGGSVRQPAAFTGMVGFKPTYGRVSRYGLVAFASSLDQIGPITQTVDDTALIYSVIAGHDPKDATSLNEPVEPYAELSAQKGRKLTIAVPYAVLDRIDADLREDFIATIGSLKNAGHTITEIDVGFMDYVVPAYYIIAPAEASSNLARFDGIRYGSRADGATKELLVASTRDKGFGEEVKRRCFTGTYVLSSGYSDQYYKKALAVKQSVRAELLKLFEKADVIAWPTTPQMPFRIGDKTDDIIYLYMADLLTIPANLAGLPAISVPVNKKGDFYTSIHFMGKPLAERDVFAAGFAVEEIRGWSR